MSEPHEPDLRSLFEDAVADVVPSDRLGQIRRATAQPPARTPRRWALVVLGAGTATAAVVAAGALVGRLGPDDDGTAGEPGDRQAAVATYFTGDTPHGERLFREFHSVPASDAPATLALEALHLLEADAGPMDPDYGTAWPDGSFEQVAVDDDGIRLTISDAAAEAPAINTPTGLQQAVYTAQAAVGHTLPVTFAAGGRSLREDVRRDRAVLAPVNISDPAEGHSVDTMLTLRGTANVARQVDSVAWSLRTTAGDVALSGDAPVSGSAWEQTTGIADLSPGTYVLTVTVLVGPDDPATDTRTLTVR